MPQVIWFPGEGTPVTTGGTNSTRVPEETAESWQKWQDWLKKPGEKGAYPYPNDNPFYGLKDPRDLASRIYGGLTAGKLEEAIGRGWITPDLANQAQIIKDVWLHAGNTNRRQQGGVGNNAAWNELLAQHPELYGTDWAAWAREMGMIAPVDEAQPVLAWQPRAFPEQYRSGANAWLRGQGYTPTGSLGQWGYTQYRRPTTMPASGPMFTSEMTNTIEDEGLRKWLQYYLSQAKLLQGNYPQPAAS